MHFSSGRDYRKDLTPAQEEELRKRFKEIDVDKSGAIGKQEFKTLVSWIATEDGHTELQGMKPKELEAAFAKFDSDGTGELEFDEFAELFIFMKNQPKVNSNILLSVESWTVGSTGRVEAGLG